MAVSFGCAAKKVPVAPSPVTISINAWPGYATAFLAQEKGFFKKNGVDVELVLRETTPESLQLFRDGKVNGCFDILTDIVLVNAQGIPAKIVFVVDYSDTGDVIIARPGITSLAGLKDRTVSFEGVNTFSHLFVLKSLERAGLDEADAKFSNVTAPDVLKALNEGKIDAGHTWEPTTSRALKEGYRILAKAGDIPGIIVDVLAFSPEVIRKRPDDIRAIVASLLEAREYLKANPAESIKIMAAKMGMAEEEMKTGIGGTYQPDLKENVNLTTTTTTTPSLFAAGRMVTDFYLERGQLSSVPDIGNIIEPRFLKELSLK